MAKRDTVGLIYSYDEAWIGGTYYILNIIHALCTLEDNKKPLVYLFTDDKKQYQQVQKQTGYPFLSFVKFPRKNIAFGYRLINKCTRLLFNKNFIERPIQYPNVNLIYPRYIEEIKGLKKKVNWYPDFQEHYLPEFFSKEEIELRRNWQYNILAKGDIAVFSSTDAISDFKRFYPEAKAEPYLLNFAVTHPDFSSRDINALKEKYNFSGDYYFLPNQFWIHKNHKIVFEALHTLKESGIEILLLLSGKESDYRSVDNVTNLKRFVIEKDLEDNIKFLGFIAREDQLCLFKFAKAIIQPSLFEGWSTVVEDAKSLNKFVIASNLKVHHEQMKTNVLFFDRKRPEDLVKTILEVENTNIDIIPNQYDQSIKKFANDFMQLIKICQL